MLALLLSRVDPDRALEALREAASPWILLAALLTAAILPIRGLRFHQIGPEAGASATTAAIGVQTFVNRIAPMRLGELSLPILLRRYAGASAAKTLVALVLVRLIEVGCILALLVLSTLIRSGSSGGAWIWILAAVFAGVAVLLVQFRYFAGLGVKAARAVARALRLVRVGAVARGLDGLEGAVEGGQRLRLSQRGALVLLTLIALVLQMLVFAAILAAFDVQLSWLAILQASCVAFLGIALPVPSVGTVGTLEAGWVAGFVWVGVDLETAILTGVATQVLTLAFSAALAIPCWLFLLRRGAAPRRDGE